MLFQFHCDLFSAWFWEHIIYLSKFECIVSLKDKFYCQSHLFRRSNKVLYSNYMSNGVFKCALWRGEVQKASIKRLFIQILSSVYFVLFFSFCWSSIQFELENQLHKVRILTVELFKIWKKHSHLTCLTIFTIQVVFQTSSNPFSKGCVIQHKTCLLYPLILIKNMQPM